MLYKLNKSSVGTFVLEAFGKPWLPMPENFQTQFGVSNTPKDNQMRSIIGSIPSSQFAPVFENYLTRLQRSKHLAAFQFQKKYLVAIDGTEYYSSDKISCSCCLTQTKRDGSIQLGILAIVNTDSCLS